MKEAILLTDGYKLDHRRQYPENTEYVYSNWTPRSCHYYPEAAEGAEDELETFRRLITEVYPTGDRAIYVTHMVNPKGIATLSENYKEVYFTNSYRDWGREALPDNVKVIEVV